MYSPFFPRGTRSEQGPGPRFGPSSTTHEHRAWEGFISGGPGKLFCSAIGVQAAASHRAYFPVHICRPVPVLRAEASSAARAVPQRLAVRASAATAVKIVFHLRGLSSSDMSSSFEGKLDGPCHTSSTALVGRLPAKSHPVSAAENWTSLPPPSVGGGIAGPQP